MSALLLQCKCSGYKNARAMRAFLFGTQGGAENCS